MSWVAAAIGGTALVAGVVGGALSSSSAKKSTEAQNRANAEIARQNLEFQRESREQNLALFREQQESALGGEREFVLDRAGNVIRTVSDFDPQQRLDEFRAFLPQTQESLAGGAQTLSDIFSGRALDEDLTRLGRITAEREAAFDLVGGQRLENVEAGRTAIDLARDNAISRIDSERVARGFRGTSSFDRNRIARQFLSAGQGQAQLEGQARLANAIGRNRITEDRLGKELALPTEFRNLQLNTLGEPLAQFNRQVTAITTPEQLLAQTFGQNISNITSAIPTFAPPGVSPLQNTFQPIAPIGRGAIIGGGLSALTSGLTDVGNFLGTRNQNAALLAQNQAFNTQSGIANSISGGGGSNFQTFAPIAPVNQPVSGVNFNVVPASPANTGFTAQSVQPGVIGADFDPNLFAAAA